MHDYIQRKCVHQTEKILLELLDILYIFEWNDLLVITGISWSCKYWNYLMFL